MQLELVIWKDIVSYHHGWTHDIPDEGAAYFHTVGWIAEENDEYLIIFSTVNANGEDCFGHDTTIPIENIVDRTKLRGRIKWPVDPD